MKPFYLLLLCLLCVSSLYAQRPRWLEQMPPQTDTYYYRIGTGYDRQSKETAIKKATANAVYESALSIGVGVDINQLDSLVQKSTLASCSEFFIIPTNIVCKYIERDMQGFWVGFVLCQVAKDARTHPDFQTFDCKTCK